MAQLNKGVRVIANASNKNLRTVKIVTSAPASDTHRFPTWVQMTAVQTAADLREFETVQDGTAAFVAGMKTVVISGYSAPN